METCEAVRCAQHDIGNLEKTVFGRTLTARADSIGILGFHTFAASQLQPGQYELRARWNRADGNPDPRTCTLTVVP